MNNNDFLNDLLNADKSSYKAKDDQKLDIVCKKGTYEETLDDMWRIYLINPHQIVEYNKQLAVIKECGCKVLRNSSGKHKIIVA